MKVSWFIGVVIQTSDKFLKDLSKYTNEILDEYGEATIIIIPAKIELKINILEDLLERLKEESEEKFIQ